MSLINKMLQDLEARQADGNAGVALPDDVRPLPQLRRSGRPWVALFGAAMLLAGGGIYYFMDRRGDEAAAQTASVVAPAQLPESRAESSRTEPETKPEALEQELRLSLRLSDIAVEEEAEATVTVPVASPPSSAKPVAELRGDPKVVAVEARPVVAPPRTEPAAERAESKTPAGVVGHRSAERVAIEKTAPASSPAERLDAAFRHAAAAAGEGRQDDAIGALQQILRQDELHVAARQLLVRLLIESGRQGEAIAVLQEGLRGQPARIVWAMTLARLQVERGESAAAAETLRNSLPAAASSPDYFGFTAHVEQRLGHHREAASLYEQAARLAPNDGRWWLGLGLAQEAEGRKDQASAAFERARRGVNLSDELRALAERKLR